MNLKVFFMWTFIFTPQIIECCLRYLDRLIEDFLQAQSTMSGDLRA